MPQGDKLKGIVPLGAKPDAQGFRPDERLEIRGGSDRLDLNRLHAPQLTRQLLQIQRERELQLQEKRVLQQELKQERGPLMPALEGRRLGVRSAKDILGLMKTFNRCSDALTLIPLAGGSNDETYLMQWRREDRARINRN